MDGSARRLPPRGRDHETRVLPADRVARVAYGMVDGALVRDLSDLVQ